MIGAEGDIDNLSNWAEKIVFANNIYIFYECNLIFFSKINDTFRVIATIKLTNRLSCVGKHFSPLIDLLSSVLMAFFLMAFRII